MPLKENLSVRYEKMDISRIAVRVIGYKLIKMIGRMKTESQFIAK